jgi:hypothetical protein
VAMATDAKVETKPAKAKTETKKIDFKNYLLKINYEVHEEEHEGYCSDPDETETSKYKTFGIYGIPEPLKNSDLFDLHLRLKGDHLSLLKKFNKKWSHGNGYCGCESRKLAISAKLIRRAYVVA